MTLLRFTAAAVALSLAACSPPAQQQSQTVQAPIQPISAAARAEMERINAVEAVRLVERATPELALAPQPAPPTPPTAATVDPAVAYDAGLARIQVLLDRAHFSPGVIDGYDGDNVRKAVSEYQARHGVRVTGVADEALLLDLANRDTTPALITYVLTTADVSGPFVAVPQDLEAMSRLAHVGYERASEAVAEKFHMDEDLLRLLNPNVDFTRAGVEIVVANAGDDLNVLVASIEVDKQAMVVRAFDASGALLAFYPATIGSGAAPAPTGDFAVRAIAFDPTYNYDPVRLPTFGERDHGALTIAAGPNNPVGAVWIALTADTYGIHGAPNPATVSKTQSHGCVRLTNWDAVELGRAVRAGAPVRFLERSPQIEASANALAPG